MAAAAKVAISRNDVVWDSCTAAEIRKDRLIDKTKFTDDTLPCFGFNIGTVKEEKSLLVLDHSADVMLNRPAGDAPWLALPGTVNVKVGPIYGQYQLLSSYGPMFRHLLTEAIEQCEWSDKLDILVLGVVETVPPLKVALSTADAPVSVAEAQEEAEKVQRKNTRHFVNLQLKFKGDNLPPLLAIALQAGMTLISDGKLIPVRQGSMGNQGALVMHISQKQREQSWFKVWEERAIRNSTTLDIEVAADLARVMREPRVNIFIPQASDILPNNPTKRTDEFLDRRTKFGIDIMIVPSVGQKYPATKTISLQVPTIEATSTRPKHEGVKNEFFYLVTVASKSLASKRNAILSPFAPPTIQLDPKHWMVVTITGLPSNMTASDDTDRLYHQIVTLYLGKVLSKRLVVSRCPQEQRGEIAYLWDSIAQGNLMANTLPSDILQVLDVNGARWHQQKGLTMSTGTIIIDDYTRNALTSATPRILSINEGIESVVSIAIKVAETTDAKKRKSLAGAPAPKISRWGDLSSGTTPTATHTQTHRYLTHAPHPRCDTHNRQGRAESTSCANWTGVSGPRRRHRHSPRRCRSPWQCHLRHQIRQASDERRGDGVCTRQGRCHGRRPRRQHGQRRWHRPFRVRTRTNRALSRSNNKREQPDQECLTTLTVTAETLLTPSHAYTNKIDATTQPTSVVASKHARCNVRPHTHPTPPLLIHSTPLPKANESLRTRQWGIVVTRTPPQNVQNEKPTTKETPYTSALLACAAIVASLILCIATATLQHHTNAADCPTGTRHSAAPNRNQTSHNRLDALLIQINGTTCYIPCPTTIRDAIESRTGLLPHEYWLTYRNKRISTTTRPAPTIPVVVHTKLLGGAPVSISGAFIHEERQQDAHNLLFQCNQLLALTPCLANQILVENLTMTNVPPDEAALSHLENQIRRQTAPTPLAQQSLGIDASVFHRIAQSMDPLEKATTTTHATLTGDVYRTTALFSTLSFPASGQQNNTHQRTDDQNGATLIKNALAAVIDDVEALIIDLKTLSQATATSNNILHSIHSHIDTLRTMMKNGTEKEEIQKEQEQLVLIIATLRASHSNTSQIAQKAHNTISTNRLARALATLTETLDNVRVEPTYNNWITQEYTTHTHWSPHTHERSTQKMQSPWTPHNNYNYVGDDSRSSKFYWIAARKASHTSKKRYLAARTAHRYHKHQQCRCHAQSPYVQVFIKGPLATAVATLRADTTINALSRLIAPHLPPDAFRLTLHGRPLRPANTTPLKPLKNNDTLWMHIKGPKGGGADKIPESNPPRDFVGMENPHLQCYLNAALQLIAWSRIPIPPAGTNEAINSTCRIIHRLRKGTTLMNPILATATEQILRDPTLLQYDLTPQIQHDATEALWQILHLWNSNAHSFTAQVVRKCTKCGNTESAIVKEGETHDIYGHEYQTVLSLDVFAAPRDDTFDVAERVKENPIVTFDDVRCNICTATTLQSYTVTRYTIPDVLFITTARIHHTLNQELQAFTPMRLNTSVTLPPTVSIPYTDRDTGNTRTAHYRLRGFVCHEGSANEGHYYAVAVHPSQQRVTVLNDGDTMEKTFTPSTYSNSVTLQCYHRFEPQPQQPTIDPAHKATDPKHKQQSENADGTPPPPKAATADAVNPTVKATADHDVATTDPGRKRKNTDAENATPPLTADATTAGTTNPTPANTATNDTIIVIDDESETIDITSDEEVQDVDANESGKNASCSADTVNLNGTSYTCTPTLTTLAHHLLLDPIRRGIQHIENNPQISPTIVGTSLFSHTQDHTHAPINDLDVNPEAQRAIDTCKTCNALVVSVPGLNLYQSGLDRLAPRRWFNQDIINWAISALDSLHPNAGIILHTSFWYKQWTSNHDIARLARWNRTQTPNIKEICFPIHKGQHWYYVEIGMQAHTITVFDSGNTTPDKTVITELLDYLQQLHSYGKHPFDASQWTTESHPDTVPQTNWYDCGPHTIANLIHRHFDLPITFRPQHALRLRQHLYDSIVRLIAHITEEGTPLLPNNLPAPPHPPPPSPPAPPQPPRNQPTPSPTPPQNTESVRGTNAESTPPAQPQSLPPPKRHAPDPNMTSTWTSPKQTTQPKPTHFSPTPLKNRYESLPHEIPPATDDVQPTMDIDTPPPQTTPSNQTDVDQRAEKMRQVNKRQIKNWEYQQEQQEKPYHIALPVYEHQHATPKKVLLEIIQNSPEPYRTAILAAATREKSEHNPSARHVTGLLTTTPSDEMRKYLEEAASNPKNNGAKIARRWGTEVITWEHLRNLQNILSPAPPNTILDTWITLLNAHQPFIRILPTNTYNAMKYGGSSAIMQHLGTQSKELSPTTIIVIPVGHRRWSIAIIHMGEQNDLIIQWDTHPLVLNNRAHSRIIANGMTTLQSLASPKNIRRSELFKDFKPYYIKDLEPELLLTRKLAYLANKQALTTTITTTAAALLPTQTKGEWTATVLAAITFPPIQINQALKQQHTNYTKLQTEQKIEDNPTHQWSRGHSIHVEALPETAYDSDEEQSYTKEEYKTLLSERLAGEQWQGACGHTMELKNACSDGTAFICGTHNIRGGTQYKLPDVLAWGRANLVSAIAITELQINWHESLKLAGSYNADYDLYCACSKSKNTATALAISRFPERFNDRASTVIPGKTITDPHGRYVGVALKGVGITTYIVAIYQVSGPSSVKRQKRHIATTTRLANHIRTAWGAHPYGDTARLIILGDINAVTSKNDRHPTQPSLREKEAHTNLTTRLGVTDSCTPTTENAIAWHTRSTFFSHQSPEKMESTLDDTTPGSSRLDQILVTHTLLAAYRGTVVFRSRFGAMALSDHLPVVAIFDRTHIDGSRAARPKEDAAKRRTQWTIPLTAGPVVRPRNALDPIRYLAQPTPDQSVSYDADVDPEIVELQIDTASNPKDYAPANSRARGAHAWLRYHTASTLTPQQQDLNNKLPTIETLQRLSPIAEIENQQSALNQAHAAILDDSANYAQKVNTFDTLRIRLEASKTGKPQPWDDAKALEVNNKRNDLIKDTVKTGIAANPTWKQRTGKQKYRLTYTQHTLIDLCAAHTAERLARKNINLRNDEPQRTTNVHYHQLVQRVHDLTAAYIAKPLYATIGHAVPTSIGKPACAILRRIGYNYLKDICTEQQLINIDTVVEKLQPTQKGKRKNTNPKKLKKTSDETTLRSFWHHLSWTINGPIKIPIPPRPTELTQGPQRVGIHILHYGTPPTTPLSQPQKWERWRANTDANAKVVREIQRGAAKRQKQNQASTYRTNFWKAFHAPRTKGEQQSFIRETFRPGENTRYEANTIWTSELECIHDPATVRSRQLEHLLEAHYEHKRPSQPPKHVGALKAVYPEGMNFYPKQPQINLFPDGKSPRTINKERVRVLQTLKLNSSPGEDGITHNLLRNLAPDAQALLWTHIDFVLETGCPPDAWRLGLVAWVPKPGLPNIYTQMRPITLLSVIMKLAMQILALRIGDYVKKDALENKGLGSPLLGYMQFAFQADRGCHDALHLMVERLEHAKATKSPLYIFISDLRKAYDRVEPWSLQLNMRQAGLPDYITKLVHNLDSASDVQVTTSHGMSDTARAPRGIKQGDPFSCLKWLLFIAPLLEWLRNTDGVSTSDHELVVNTLCFADDLALLHTNEQVLKKLVNKCNEYFAFHNIDFQPKKCYYAWTNHPSDTDPTPPQVFQFTDNTPPTEITTLPTPNITTDPSLSPLPPQQQSERMRIFANANPIGPDAPFKYLGILLTASLKWSHEEKRLEEKLRADLTAIEGAAAAGMLVRALAPHLLLIKVTTGLLYSLQVANIPHSTIERWTSMMGVTGRHLMGCHKSLANLATYSPHTEWGIQIPNLTAHVREKRIFDLAIRLNHNNPYIKNATERQIDHITNEMNLPYHITERPIRAIALETHYLAATTIHHMCDLRVTIHQQRLPRNEYNPPNDTHMLDILSNPIFTTKQAGHVWQGLKQLGIDRYSEIHSPCGTLIHSWPGLLHSSQTTTTLSPNITPKWYRTLRARLTEENYKSRELLFPGHPHTHNRSLLEDESWGHDIPNAWVIQLNKEGFERLTGANDPAHANSSAPFYLYRTIPNEPVTCTEGSIDTITVQWFRPKHHNHLHPEALNSVHQYTPTPGKPTPLPPVAKGKRPAAAIASAKISQTYRHDENSQKQEGVVLKQTDTATNCESCAGLNKTGRGCATNQCEFCCVYRLKEGRCAAHGHTIITQAFEHDEWIGKIGLSNSFILPDNCVSLVTTLPLATPTNPQKPHRYYIHAPDNPKAALERKHLQDLQIRPPKIITRPPHKFISMAPRLATEPLPYLVECIPNEPPPDVNATCIIVAGDGSAGNTEDDPQGVMTFAVSSALSAKPTGEKNKVIIENALEGIVPKELRDANSFAPESLALYIGLLLHPSKHVHYLIDNRNAHDLYEQIQQQGKLTARQRLTNSARPVWNMITRAIDARKTPGRLPLIVHKVRSHVTTKAGAHPVHVAVDEWLSNYQQNSANAIEADESTIPEEELDDVLRMKALYNRSLAADDEDWIMSVGGHYTPGNLRKALEHASKLDLFRAAPTKARSRSNKVTTTLAKEVASKLPATLRTFLTKTIYNTLPTIAHKKKLQLSNDNCVCQCEAQLATQQHVLQCSVIDDDANRVAQAIVVSNHLKRSAIFATLYPTTLWPSNEEIETALLPLQQRGTHEYTRVATHQASGVTAIDCNLTTSQQERIHVAVREERFWLILTKWEIANKGSDVQNFGTALADLWKEIVTESKTLGKEPQNSWATPESLTRLLARYCHLTVEAFCHPFNADFTFTNHFSGHNSMGAWGSQFDAFDQDWNGRFIYANPPYTEEHIRKLIAKADQTIMNATAPTRIVAVLPSSAKWEPLLQSSKTARLLCEFDKDTICFKPHDFWAAPTPDTLYSGGHNAHGAIPTGIRILVWETPQAQKQFPISTDLRKETESWFASHIKITHTQVKQHQEKEHAKTITVSEKTGAPEAYQQCMCTNEHWDPNERLTTTPKLTLKEARTQLTREKLKWGALLRKQDFLTAPKKAANDETFALLPLVALPIVPIPWQRISETIFTKALKNHGEQLKLPPIDDTRLVPPETWITLNGPTQTSTPTEKEIELSTATVTYWWHTWKAYTKANYERENETSNQSDEQETLLTSDSSESCNNSDSEPSAFTPCDKKRKRQLGFHKFKSEEKPHTPWKQRTINSILKRKEKPIPDATKIDFTKPMVLTYITPTKKRHTETAQAVPPCTQCNTPIGLAAKRLQCSICKRWFHERHLHEQFEDPNTPPIQRRKNFSNMKLKGQCCSNTPYITPTTPPKATPANPHLFSTVGKCTRIDGTQKHTLGTIVNILYDDPDTHAIVWWNNGTTTTHTQRDFNENISTWTRACNTPQYKQQNLGIEYWEKLIQETWQSKTTLVARVWGNNVSYGYANNTDTVVSEDLQTSTMTTTGKQLEIAQATITRPCQATLQNAENHIRNTLSEMRKRENHKQITQRYNTTTPATLYYDAITAPPANRRQLLNAENIIDQPIITPFGVVRLKPTTDNTGQSTGLGLFVDTITGTPTFHSSSEPRSTECTICYGQHPMGPQKTICPSCAKGPPHAVLSNILWFANATSKGRQSTFTLQNAAWVGPKGADGKHNATFALTPNKPTTQAGTEITWHYEPGRRCPRCQQIKYHKDFKNAKRAKPPLPIEELPCNSCHHKQNKE